MTTSSGCCKRSRPIRRLGSSGGECLELDGGEWRAVHVTSSHVRGAVRAYRRECLDIVLPLVEGLGWDTVDELQASVHGWRVAVVPGLYFRHHRALGARDGFPWSRAVRQGRAAHYLGYRFWYLAARSRLPCSDEPDCVRHALGLRRERDRPSARAPRRSSSRRTPSATGSRRASYSYPRGVRPAVAIVALTHEPPSAAVDSAAACTQHSQ